MTNREAADSMRSTARRLRAWAAAVRRLMPDVAPAFEAAMGREAAKLEADAGRIEASAHQEAG